MRVKALQRVLEAMQGEDPEILRHPAMAEAVNAATRDSDAEVRMKAEACLEVVSRVAVASPADRAVASPAVTAGLLAALRDDKDEWVRHNSAEALMQLGTAPPDVVEELLNFLNGADSDVRGHAAAALGKVASPSPAVRVGLMAAALHDQNENVRRTAADSLGELSATADDLARIAGGLVAHLRDRHAEVRRHAAEALGALRGATWEGLAELIAVMSGDKNQSVRAAAAESLGWLRTATPDVIAGLKDALKDGDPSVRQEAALALATLKSANAEAMAVLNERIV